MRKISITIITAVVAALLAACGGSGGVSERQACHQFNAANLDYANGGNDQSFGQALAQIHTSDASMQQKISYLAQQEQLGGEINIANGSQDYDYLTALCSGMG